MGQSIQGNGARNLNRAALSCVLGNLLNNALKYSGGDLDVTLTADGTITLSNAAPELFEIPLDLPREGG